MKIKALYLIAVIFFSGYKGHANDSELNFTTEQLREMWGACTETFKSKYPQITSKIRINLCDCYADYIRVRYDQESFDDFSPKDTKRLGKEISKVCKISEEILDKSKLPPKLST